MMYTIEDLENLENSGNHEEALGRYLNKFLYRRKEIKKLKLHEKDFLFSEMRAFIKPQDGLSLSDLNDLRERFDDEVALWKYLEANGLAEKGFSLYEIQEANDFLFYTIVLNYFNNLHFLAPSFGPYGPLSKEEIQRDADYFNERLIEWKTLLFSNRGLYVPPILNEYNRKKKLLEEQRKNNVIGYNKYLHKLKELAVISFSIFYKTRYFFENLKRPYYDFTLNNLKFVFDIYSYVHIHSRHYMPSLNDFDLKRTFNSHIPFIDVDKMPVSIERLLINYSTYRSLTSEDEYLIFQFKSFCYILWVDYRNLRYFDEKVMQIRSLYKIQETRDIEKFTALKRVKVCNNFYFFV